MWVICIGCHHAAQVKPLPKGKRLRCTACGSSVARVVRRLKISMLNGGPMPPELAKLSTYAGLISIASSRGYKPIWAVMKYKAIYGKLPPRPAPPPENPTNEVLWWIRRENRAYAIVRRELEGDHPAELAEPVSILMSAEDYEVKL